MAIRRGRRVAGRTVTVVVALIAGTLAFFGASATTASAEQSSSGKAPAPASRLVVSTFHACTVQPDGAAWCWGRSRPNGVTMPVGQESTPSKVMEVPGGIRQLAGGSVHLCALSGTGAVWCMGQNGSGQLGIGSAPVTPGVPQQVVGLGSGVRSIQSGSTHTCAVTDTGALHCWGANNLGQLGDGSSTSRNQPVAVALGGTVEDLSLGSNTSCAVLSTGRVWCWGDNAQRQLGSGTASSSTQPLLVPTVTGARLVTTGSTTCATTTAGVTRCWGSNGGRIPSTSTSPVTSPTVVAGVPTDLVDLQVTRSSICAQTPAGRLSCWGGGPLLGTTGSSPQLLTVPGGPIRQFASGGAGTCVTDDLGDVRCWGAENDIYNHVGVTPGAVSFSRSAIESAPGPWAEVSVGYEACGVDAVGTVSCWGHGSGASGLPRSTQPRPLPGQPGPLHGVRQHTHLACGLTTIGGVVCWGIGDDGELGDGSESTSRSAPVAVPGLTSGMAEVTVGADHACARSESGGVSCWGSNRFGAIGDGTGGEGVLAAFAPTPVQGLATDVVQITTGGYHSCALLTSGEVRCWGRNDRAQIDPAAVDLRAAPVTVALGGTASEIAAGASYTCAVVGGTAQCWGDNDSGQTGRPATSTRQTSVLPVLGLGSGVDRLTTVDQHTCARRSGSIWCWGAFFLAGDATPPYDGGVVPVAGTDGATAVAGGNLASCALVGGAARCWGMNTGGLLGRDDGTTPALVDVTAAVPLHITVSTIGDADPWSRSTVVRTTCTGGVQPFTCPADQVVADGADRSVTVTVTDGAGASASATVSDLDVDGTAPTVAITGVTDGATYLPGAVPTAGCTTSDATSGVATEATPAVTGGPVDFTATCAGATDVAGNEGDPVTATYRVSAPGRSISGVVRAESTGAPIAGLQVRLYREGTSGSTFVTTAADGSYRFDPLPLGTYTVWFRDLSKTWVSEYHADAPTAAGATAIELGTVDHRVVDAQLAAVPAPAAKAAISGRVTDSSGDPIVGIQVRLYADGSTSSSAATTGPDGRYTFTNRTNGSYKLWFRDVDLRTFRSEYHADAPTLAEATPVVLSGTDRTVNAVLDRLVPIVPGSIAGQVTGPDGQPLAGIQVRLYQDGATGSSATTTDAEGRYAFANRKPGTYRVWFRSIDGTWRSEYHQDATSLATATLLELGNGGAIGASATLARP